IISYDSPRGGVSVITEKGDTTTSFLLIQNARPSDSGQYTCNPSNAKSKSVTVHVLNGEYPAAMQRAGQPHHRTPLNHQLLVLASVLASSLLCSIGMLRLPSPSGGRGHPKGAFSPQQPRKSFVSS
uniref:Ig-like domain-containing protein n=1 Tax=Anopheles dirus TaxID=7168 RepID=A0A182NDU3_9DIPT